MKKILVLFYVVLGLAFIFADDDTSIKDNVSFQKVFKAKKFGGKKLNFLQKKKKILHFF